MKLIRILLATTVLLLSATASMAQTVQPKLPIIDGDQAEYPIFYRDDVGVAYGWWWWGTNTNKWMYSLYWLTYAGMPAVLGTTAYDEIMSSKLSEYMKSSDKKATFALWVAQYGGTRKGPCFMPDGSYNTVLPPDEQRLCGAATAKILAKQPKQPPASYQPPVVVKWMIAPNSLSTSVPPTRPSREVVNGALVTMKVPVSLPVGTTCDSTITPTFASNSDAWMGVQGQPANLRWLCRKG